MFYDVTFHQHRPRRLGVEEGNLTFTSFIFERAEEEKGTLLQL
jgi:hypothetical protein